MESSHHNCLPADARVGGSEHTSTRVSRFHGTLCQTDLLAAFRCELRQETERHVTQVRVVYKDQWDFLCAVTQSHPTCTHPSLVCVRPVNVYELHRDQEITMEKGSSGSGINKT